MDESVMTGQAGQYEDHDLPMILLPVYCIAIVFLFLLWYAKSLVFIVIQLDHTLTLAITDWVARVELERVGWWTSRIGDGWAYLALYGAYRYMGKRQEAEHLAEALFLAWAVVAFIKAVVRRARPESSWVSGKRVMRWSFPSQHAATVVAM